MTPRILVISGSVRAARISPKFAGWLTQLGAKANPEATFETVDLRDWPLPMDDEPDVPRVAAPEKEHTKKWAQYINDAAGFVFLCPEYNGGYPAALKNAIDHLYGEWNGKPAAVVAFGGSGGDDGARQLTEVLQAVKITVVGEALLRLPRSVVLARGVGFEPANEYVAQEESIAKLMSDVVAKASVQN